MARAAGRSKAKGSRKAESVDPLSRRIFQSDQQVEERKLWHLTLWQIIALAILVAGAVLRLYMVTDKVFHHDEGVNGNFMVSLFRTGYYHYDPANYHGPTLYYAALLTSSVASFFEGKAGLNDFTLRVVTVIFGLGVVWLILCLRKWLGSVGSLTAAALAAVSCGFVFFSRYFIHEILFVFFTLGVLVALLKFFETRRPLYVGLAAALLALLGATKETWIITVGVWVIALPCTWLWLKIRGRSFADFWADRRGSETSKPQSDIPQPATAKPWSNARLLTMAAGVFVAIWIIFYSSFFTNPHGILDSVITYTIWSKTGSAANVYPWTRYFDWLSRVELPILILGALGILSAMGRARSRFAVFTAFWAIGIFMAYSLVPYKTPWLALNIVLPFVILCGYFFEHLGSNNLLKAVAYVGLAAAIGVENYQAIQISFFRYDDSSAAYSYAHSSRDFLNLIHEIEKIAAGNPAGKEIGVTEMSPEYWPMPWYLRDYTHVGFWGHVVPTNEPLIVALQTQTAEVEEKFGDRYRLIGQYDLRPGNRLYLYLRRDLQP